MPTALLVIYCVLILLASLAGGWIPMFVRLTHAKMQIAISFVAGVMLGVGLLHMLPHAIAEIGADHVDQIVLWLLAGFLTMFFVERFFCFHHHDVPHDPSDHDSSEGTDNRTGGQPMGPVDQHGPHELTWGGAAVGLTLHSVLAGVALAAAVAAQWEEGRGGWTAGLGVFLVIVLHKPMDAMTVGALMAVGNWSKWARHLVNGLFALAIPLGAVLFHVGLAGPSGVSSAATACALAFSAGMFSCIAMSDLLPELHFHRHDRVALSAALLAGLLVAWGIGLFEPHGHEAHHDRPHEEQMEQGNSHQEHSH